MLKRLCFLVLAPEETVIYRDAITPLDSVLDAALRNLKSVIDWSDITSTGKLICSVSLSGNRNVAWKSLPLRGGLNRVNRVVW